MRRPRSVEGALPITPKRKWQTITVATLLFVPAFWAILAGLVSGARDEVDGAPNTAVALAFGIAIIPFVFIVLAFMSEHPRASTAALKAMGLALLVGIPVSALAADAVSGLVAAIGAGGAVALRPEPGHGWKPRALAVLIATVYVFALIRTAGVLALLPAPVFPLTALGLADNLVDWRREQGRRNLAPN